MHSISDPRLGEFPLDTTIVHNKTQICPREPDRSADIEPLMIGVWSSSTTPPSPFLSLSLR